MLNLILLMIALSIDTFIASFSYGSSNIRIPKYSSICISIICSAMICGSLYFGNVLSPLLPKTNLKEISAFLLLIVGIIKLLEDRIKKWLKTGKKELSVSCFNLHLIIEIYKDFNNADQDYSKSLSVKEAMSLSIALSLDGVVGGITSGFVTVNLWMALILSFMINYLAILIGEKLGKKLNAKIKTDISWLAGILFIIIALFRMYL